MLVKIERLFAWRHKKNDREIIEWGVASKWVSKYQWGLLTLLAHA